MKFPLKDGREVEVVRPFGYRQVGQEERLDPTLFECEDGEPIKVEQIDEDGLTAEHARWFLRFSKEFYNDVSKAYRESKNRDTLDQD